MADESFVFGELLIVAHRGFSAAYPENTLVAFKAALAAEADMIEFDVRLTRDHEVVVIHDADLERTTDGNGLVGQYSLVEIKQLDAGAWFHPRFVGERIPTLEEVIDIVSGRALMNIEIKGGDSKSSSATGVIEEKVVAIIREKKVASRVLISSFDPHILETLYNRYKFPNTALLWDDGAIMESVSLCKKLKVISFHPEARLLNQNILNTIHATSIFVIPFDANSENEIRRLIDMGADGFIVDDPKTARRCFRDAKGKMIQA